MISREEAIRHFEYGVSHDIFKEPVTSYAKLAIEALSTERPKGRWVGWHTDKFVGYDEYGLEIYRHCHYYSCRKCGRRTAVKTNYCPDCGADMREEKENER